MSSQCVLFIYFFSCSISEAGKVKYSTSLSQKCKIRANICEHCGIVLLIEDRHHFPTSSDNDSVNHREAIVAKLVLSSLLSPINNRRTATSSHLPNIILSNENMPPKRTSKIGILGVPKRSAAQMMVFGRFAEPLSSDDSEEDPDFELQTEHVQGIRERNQGIEGILFETCVLHVYNIHSRTF